MTDYDGLLDVIGEPWPGDDNPPPAKVIFAARPLEGRLQEVYFAVKNLGWISGSFATWAANANAPAPGDLDIFCRTDECDQDGISNHEQICRALEAIDFRQTKVTDYSETFVDLTGRTNLFVQVIYARPMEDLLGEAGDFLKRFGETPEKLVVNFDLSVAQAVLVAPDKVWVSPDWQMDMPEKRASVVNTTTPLRTAERLGRYAAKGYQVNTYEYVKLFDAWGEMTDEQKGYQYYV